jgi:hypothetical protein
MSLPLRHSQRVKRNKNYRGASDAGGASSLSRRLVRHSICDGGSLVRRRILASRSSNFSVQSSAFDVRCSPFAAKEVAKGFQPIPAYSREWGSWKTSNAELRTPNLEGNRRNSRPSCQIVPDRGWESRVMIQKSMNPLTQKPIGVCTLTKPKMFPTVNTLDFETNH